MRGKNEREIPLELYIRLECCRKIIKMIQCTLRVYIIRSIYYESDPNLRTDILKSRMFLFL